MRSVVLWYPQQFSHEFCCVSWCVLDTCCVVLLGNLFYNTQDSLDWHTSMAHTLILNQDFTPLSVIPLSTRTWQDAMRLWFGDETRPVEFYQDWRVHSARQSWPVPSVMAWNPVLDTAAATCWCETDINANTAVVLWIYNLLPWTMWFPELKVVSHAGKMLYLHVDIATV